MKSYALALLGALILVGAARAQDATYTYSGASMSGTESGSTIGPNEDYGQYSYCCTTLGGSMTLAAPLAPNMTNAVVDPLSLTLNFSTIGGPTAVPAGAHAGGAINGSAGGTLFNSNFGFYTAGGVGSNNLLASPSMTVSTNSAGQISGWDLSFFTDPPNEALYPGALGIGGWEGQITTTGDSLTYDGGTHGPIYTLSDDDGGSWTTAASAAPEINGAGATSALTLLLGMLAVVSGRRRSGGLTGI